MPVKSSLTFGQATVSRSLPGVYPALTSIRP